MRLMQTVFIVQVVQSEVNAACHSGLLYRHNRAFAEAFESEAERCNHKFEWPDLAKRDAENSMGLMFVAAEVVAAEEA
jgi:hypothetical protein